MSIFEHINKKAVVTFGIIAALLLGFFFYSLSEKEQSSPEITMLPVSPQGATLGHELLSVLAELKSTKLDTSIFADPVFDSLKDFGVEIASEPVGRRNPFALFEEMAPAQRSNSVKSKVPVGFAGKPVSAPKAPAVEGFDLD